MSAFSDPVVIVGAARTPIGGFVGTLSSLSAPQLASYALEAVVKQVGLAPHLIEQNFMGCVLSAGLGQAPARQALLGAGLPESVPCTTINKMCGSGAQAVVLAHDALLAQSANVVLAGGMESMSQAPYLVKRLRNGLPNGLKMGHAQFLDSMFLDGLEDAYDKDAQGARCLMGSFAEDCASQFSIGRKAQDDFARASFERARKAQQQGYVDREITPITIKERAQSIQITRDELPDKSNLNKIEQLKPVFAVDGTITAANASSIADGAAALLLMRQSMAERLGYAPLARIVGHAVAARLPAEFTIAPIDSINKLLQKVSWRMSEVDAWEINEAFAVIVLAAMQSLKLPHEKVNIFGGACALGHPIGATGARMIVTLLNVLQQTQGKKGVACACIGGGEAIALALEIM